ncbi:hypothetical protein ACLOJK_026924 [Asimina triloba]
MPGVFFSSTSRRRSSPKPSSSSSSPAVHRAAVNARADYIACIFADVAARACTRVRPPLPVPASARARLCPLPHARYRLIATVRSTAASIINGHDCSARVGSDMAHSVTR